MMYHTQQCTEKALKAYLAVQQQEIQKTHNLLRLINLCAQLDQSFETLLDQAVFLNPFSTKFRYPDDMILDPGKDEVQQAITYAEKILRFVEDKIKQQIDPNMRLFSNGTQ